MIVCLVGALLISVLSAIAAYLVSEDEFIMSLMCIVCAAAIFIRTLYLLS